MPPLVSVSALSGESILGPPKEFRTPPDISGRFQHSLVSLFWGHPHSLALAAAFLPVSALSGESILGPPFHPALSAQTTVSVSALSGESILGPRVVNIDRFAHQVFQHSLVSLFWGHVGTRPRLGFSFCVSALSGESILGPPRTIFELCTW